MHSSRPLPPLVPVRPGDANYEEFGHDYLHEPKHEEAVEQVMREVLAREAEEPEPEPEPPQQSPSQLDPPQSPPLQPSPLSQPSSSLHPSPLSQSSPVQPLQQLQPSPPASTVRAHPSQVYVDLAHALIRVAFWCAGADAADLLCAADASSACSRAYSQPNPCCISTTRAHRDRLSCAHARGPCFVCLGPFATAQPCGCNAAQCHRRRWLSRRHSATTASATTAD